MEYGLITYLAGRQLWLKVMVKRLKCRICRIYTAHIASTFIYFLLVLYLFVNENNVGD